MSREHASAVGTSLSSSRTMESLAINVSTFAKESRKRCWSQLGLGHTALNRACSTSGRGFSSTTMNLVTVALCVLSTTTLFPSALPAEAMIFARNGNVRATDGWTFHDTAKESTSPKALRTFAAMPLPGVLEAIITTAARHERNQAIQDMGLSAEGWHALFCALIEAESAYNPTALSPKGAYGLGQLMATTARDLGVDRTDIAQNLDGSARYLLAQLAAFKDVDLALAAYNAGPHRVDEYGGVPPFSETQNYIARVHRIRARLSNPSVQKFPRTVARHRKRPAVVLDLN